MRVVEGDNDLALLGRSQDSNNGIPDRRGSVLLENKAPKSSTFFVARQIKKAQSTRSAPLVRPKPNLTQLIPSESGAKTSQTSQGQAEQRGRGPAIGGGYW
jgi:hypothetical protein